MIEACQASNQTQMLDICGLSNSAASIWKKRGEVPDSSIAKVHEKTGISFAWIKHGTGECRQERQEKPADMAGRIADAQAEYNGQMIKLSRDEFALIKIYRKLSDQGKDDLIGMADALSDIDN